MARFVMAGVVAFVCVFSLFIYGASAHGPYEPSCCSDRDCAPVPDATVTETPEGFTLNDTGEFVARTSSRVRRPLNEEYHLCRSPSGLLLCIYPKYRGG